MSRVFDFSSWSAEAIRARLGELRAAKAGIEAEELALIGALERLRRPSVAPGSDGGGAGGTGVGGVDGSGVGGSGDSGGSLIPPGTATLDLSPGSAVEVLTEEAQISSSAARATVALAVALGNLPEIADAFGKGEISREVAQEIVVSMSVVYECSGVGSGAH